MHEIYIFEYGPLCESPNASKCALAAEDGLVARRIAKEPRPEIDSGLDRPQNAGPLFQEPYTEPPASHSGV